MAQLVKTPPATWETWVWSLGWEDPLEKGKATHSSILAWRIPWTPWTVQSMGSQSRTWLSLSHGNSLFWTSLMAQGSPDGKSLCQQCRRPYLDPWIGKIPWRRKWQPTPVLLPGKSHGQRSLIGYSPWGHKESDTTEQLHFHFSLVLFLIYLFGCARS